MSRLLKAASDVAAVMKVFVEMSDSVTKAASPLDTQGRLLHFQNCVQKNRPRVVKLVDELCNMIEQETGKKVT